MLIEGAYNDNWPRCEYQSAYPTNQAICDAVGAFRCDRCHAVRCMLHIRIDLPPAVVELCTTCRDHERSLSQVEATRQATAVARQLARVGQVSHEGKRGVRSWLARLFEG